MEINFTFNNLKLKEKEVKILIKNLEKIDVCIGETYTYQKNSQTGGTLFVKKIMTTLNYPIYITQDNFYSGASYYAHIRQDNNNNNYYLEEIGYKGNNRGYLCHKTDMSIHFLLNILGNLTSKKKDKYWNSIYCISISSNYIKKLTKDEHNCDDTLYIYKGQKQDKILVEKLQKLKEKMNKLDTNSMLYNMCDKILGICGKE